MIPIGGIKKEDDLMPVYGFKCKKCGEDFSLLLSFSRKKEAACPSCKSKDLKEDFSGYGSGSKSKDASTSTKFT